MIAISAINRNPDQITAAAPCPSPRKSRQMRAAQSRRRAKLSAVHRPRALSHRILSKSLTDEELRPRAHQRLTE